MSVGPGPVSHRREQDTRSEEAQQDHGGRHEGGTPSDTSFRRWLDIEGDASASDRIPLHGVLPTVGVSNEVPANEQSGQPVSDAISEHIGNIVEHVYNDSALGLSYDIQRVSVGRV